MGSLEQRMIELAKEIEAMDDQRQAKQEELNQILQTIGLGKMAQDPSTGIVYKVVKPKGKYTFFADIDYVRTAKPEERSGSLSKKEAEEAGYVLKKA